MASACTGLMVQAESLDTTVVRTADDPFAPDGGLKTLTGNLGASVIKTSAVDPRTSGRDRPRSRLRQPGAVS